MVHAKKHTLDRFFHERVVFDPLPTRLMSTFLVNTHKIQLQSLKQYAANLLRKTNLRGLLDL